MSTIITRNSANSGSQPSSLVQGELAINVTDGRLFYGSGSGNDVKEFGVTASYALNALSASYAISASYEINYETSSSYADFAVSASYALNADNATSASYASQAGNAAAIDIYSFSSPVDSYLLMSNVIAATGVAVGGDTDLRYNASTNTLTAVNVSATSLTGSLLGTASYAVTAITSSYPIAASGSMMYSVLPSALSVGKNNTILLGAGAGTGTTSIYNSNYIGYGAGGAATNAYQSNFIGVYAGNEAAKADNSNFIGLFAGYKATSASFSTLIGWQAGYTSDSLNSIGTNNIIIGTNITLPSKSRDSINLGGIIFATGSYSTISGDPSLNPQYGIGKVGINKITPSYTLDVSGSGNYSNGLTVTGSLIATSFTGSLLGTASYAITAQTASYVLNAVSASYSTQALSSSYALTASFVTASNVYGPYGSNSVISASYASSSAFSSRTTQIDVYVLNQSGASIAKGVVVRITGSNNSSDIPRIVTASYENDNYSANTLGITTTAIANGDNGYVITEGVLTGIDTQAFTSGQLIYLGATGSIIGYAPVAPLHAVRLGEVIRQQSNNGSIYVRIDNGYELDELHDVLITSASSGDLLVRSGSVWINNKQLTGSYGLTGSLNATSFTGSLFGTSSWASNATTAQTASYVLNAVSASYALTASYVNPLTQNVIITGSTNITNTGGGIPSLSIQSSGTNINPYIQIVSDSTVSTTQLVAARSSGTGGVSVTGINRAYLNLLNAAGYHNVISSNDGLAFSAYTHTGYDPVNDQMRLKNGNLGIGTGYSATARLDVQAPGTSSSDIAFRVVNSGSATNIFSILGNRTLIHSGSVLITGSLTVTEGITGSLQGTATTASYVLNAVSASFATTASYYGGSVTSASYALTASYVLNAVSASYATLAQTANTASYVVTAQTASYVLQAVSASFASTASYYGGSVTSASYALTASYSNTSTSASYALNATNATTASYVLNAVSASYATLAQTANTASYVVTAQTASYVLNAVSASFATLAQTANTASYVVTAQTASYVQTAQTASYVLQAVSASFATTASYVKNAQTASYVLNAVSASYATNALSSSYAATASYYGGSVTSASYALTASYVNPLTQNVIVTGSLTSTANVQANKFVFTDGVINTNIAGQNMFAVGGNYLYLYTGTNGLYINNQANSANNVIISDAGVVQTRGALTVGSPGNDQNINFGGSNSTLDWAGTGAKIQYSVGALQFSSVGSPSNMVLAMNGGATFNYGITGSLLGTASYATQALSASWAPAGNPFPYNGDAQISGSLGVTGSFSTQVYNGAGYADAIQITDTVRNIYDVSGIGSIDATNRFLLDSSGTTTSINWSTRALKDSAGNEAVQWDYNAQAQGVNINSYARKYIGLTTTAETFSNFTVYGNFQPDGEILERVTLDSSVVDFDLVFLETDGIWYPVDMTTNSASKLLGIAWAVGSGKEKVLLEGTMVVNNSALTDTPQVAGIAPGLPIYIRTAGGTYMSTIAPSTSGNYVRVLGHAYYQGATDPNYWVMKFRPANDWYVI